MAMQSEEINQATRQPDPDQAACKDFHLQQATAGLSAAFSSEEFAGKQGPEGRQTGVNCAISESSFLSHAQRTPNLKIPAASSYETTIEERNRWLKPLGEKKKKKIKHYFICKRERCIWKYGAYFRPYLIDIKYATCRVEMQPAFRSGSAHRSLTLLEQHSFVWF